MARCSSPRLADPEDLPDTALVARARGGDETAMRVMIQRHNRRLFRAARGVLRDDAEAEDVVQAAWVRAFTALDGFRGEAALPTWLTRIALNEALGPAAPPPPHHRHRSAGRRKHHHVPALP